MLIIFIWLYVYKKLFEMTEVDFYNEVIKFHFGFIFSNKLIFSWSALNLRFWKRSNKVVENKLIRCKKILLLIFFLPKCFAEHQMLINELNVSRALMIFVDLLYKFQYCFSNKFRKRGWSDKKMCTRYFLSLSIAVHYIRMYDLFREFS